MGRGYVIEHCISTFKYMQEQEAYQVYVTEVLRGIAKSAGVEMGAKFADVLKAHREPQKVETRTPNEIIGNIKARAEVIRNA